MGSGFRIFAFEESPNEIPARRVRTFEHVPDPITIFVHARVLHPGEYSPITQISMKLGDSIELISLSFDRQDIPLTFSSALLGSVLMILQRTQKNIPLLISSSSDFSSRVLVTDREKYENDILDPSC
jgi:hypothetical protein